MSRGVVAVLCGGWSAERDISLVSGSEVLRALKGAGRPAVALDLVPDAAGPAWDRAARERATPAWAARVPLSGLIPGLRRRRAGVVFLALHGTGGEDGRVQGLLELAGMTYTGSGVQASSLAMDKERSKRLFREAGLPVPGSRLCPPGGNAGAFRGPCVVKPRSQGSAVGVSLVRKAGQMKAALESAWRWGDALVEDYVAGRELTVGVLGGRALPLVEIVPQGEFYDWDSKYRPGGSRHLCPAPVPAGLAREAGRLGLKAHQVLGCRGYSRSDMMLDKAGRLWLLETNTLPGMTPVSLFPDAARRAGLGFEALVARMVELARRGE